MNGIFEVISKADILIVGIIFYVFNYIMSTLHDIKQNTDKLLELNEKNLSKDINLST